MAASDSSGSNLVLRTVYLPKDLDDQLRRLAFDQQKSKNDLIRSAVTTALEVWMKAAAEK
jgi:predicted transcriptional regulator